MPALSADGRVPGRIRLMQDEALKQAEAAAEVVVGMFGKGVLGVYLYGSATMAGLRAHSDLDVLALVEHSMTGAQRWELARHLISISRAGQRPAEWRPLEVTVLARPDIEPWRHPAIRDFQYGEWLRDEVDAGTAKLGPLDDADVALLITLARRFGRPVVGPAPEEALPDISKRDLFAALQRTVDDVQPGLESDATNGLLTLARVWFTLETGDFAPKDAAGEWALARLEPPLRTPLELAVGVYRGKREADWAGIAAERAATADAMVAAIQRYDGLP